MGKRKSSKPPPKKKIPKVATVFNCPFCNHQDAVDCKLDRKLSVGTLKCRICGVDFSTEINELSEPIDIYGDWIDECNRINNIDRADEHNRDSPP